MKVVFALIVLVPLVLSAEDFRVFTDSAGRKIEAEVVKSYGGSVTLRVSNGRTFSLRLDKLSAEDQEHILSLPKMAEAGRNEALELEAQAAKIDELVAEGIRAASEKLGLAHERDVERARANKLPELAAFVPITPNPPLMDEPFVRRAYLDIVGTIPTAAQVTEFLNDGSADKRAALIDRLLDSKGHASHLYNELADMLRIKTNADLPYVKRLAYGDWLMQQLIQNRPYDQIVREMITAKGKAWQGPAGFYLRDRGMAMKHLTHTMWAFLGTDVSCAQCHDHAYADWTQRQFYELAAFFSGVRLEKPMPRFAEDLVSQAGQLGSDKKRDPLLVRYSVRNVLRANLWQVWDEPGHPLTLPPDYKYRDGKPGEAVAPKFIAWESKEKSDPRWMEATEALQKEGPAAPRDVFARWLTHPQNPRFAMTMAHRLWTMAFGKPIATCCSTNCNYLVNINDPGVSSNPALLEHLAAEMVRVKFDLKAFLRLVYNTKSWQRAATTEDVPRGQPYYFQGPVLRRMSAEQMWDSLVTLALGEAPMPRNTVSDLYGRSVDLDLSNPKLDAQTVLLKMAAAGNVEQRARKDLDEAQGAHRLPLKFAGLTLIRASAHEQPTAPEHPLRTFGQSDREWMDSNTTGGSVPLVLALMNGSLSMTLANEDGHVLRARQEAGEGEKGVESLFLSVLGRRPSAHEIEVALAGSAWADVAWALLNTREFLFVQ